MSASAFLLISAVKQKEDRLETLTDTLIERIDNLIEAGKEPLLTTTTTSVAIRELAARNEALEDAVREIALEVHRLSTLAQW